MVCENEKKCLDSLLYSMTEETIYDEDNYQGKE